MEKKITKSSEDLSPLQDKIDEDLFFSGGKRRKTLNEIKKAVEDGVAVITLTGEEGTGKTTLCRMTAKELSSEFTCVYLPNTLESFDDVIRVIALELDTDHSYEPGSASVLVSEIKENLQENDRQLVIIFDQAERMYLATIERIRKMIDQINSDEDRLQLVFAGRPSLLENLKQLHICDFCDVEERDFFLQPLGLSETYAYLNHLAQQKHDKHGKNIFTPEIAKKIHAMAHGNQRLISMLAAKAIDAAESDTSYIELLEAVDVNKTIESQFKSKAVALRKKMMRKRLIYGCTGLVGIILLLFLFRGEEQVEDVVVSSSERLEEQKAVPEDIEETAENAVSEKASAIPAEKPSPQPSGETPEIVVVPVTEPGAGVNKEEEVQSSEKTGGEKVIATSRTEGIEEAAVEKKVEVVAAESSQSVADTSDAVKEKIESVSTQIFPEQPEESENVAAATVEDEGEDIRAEPIIVQNIAAVKKKKVRVVERGDEQNREQAAMAGEPSLSAEPQEIIDEQDTDVQSLRDNVQEKEVDDEQPAEAQEQIISQQGEADESGQIALSPLAVRQNKDALVEESDALEDNAADETAMVTIADAATSLEPVNIESTQDTEEAATVADLQDVVILAEVNKKLPPGVIQPSDAKKIVRIAPVRLQQSSTGEADENVETAAVQPGEVYRNRLAAGSNWYSSEKKNLFTVQLMVLTADQAEENLRDKFGESNYREIADNLYIIKNDEAKVFVFYGEYPDLETAKQARNTLPLFLREHDPYTVSVREALDKAGFQE